jgi:hypothetical protein
METRQLHVRITIDEMDSLKRVAEKCQLNATALGVILIKSAIRAVVDNQERVPLPLELKVKTTIDTLNDPKSLKYAGRR